MRERITLIFVKVRVLQQQQILFVWPSYCSAVAARRGEVQRQRRPLASKHKDAHSHTNAPWHHAASGESTEV